MSAASASRRSSAARRARAASSSSTRGTPNTAITSSPMNLSTVPPWLTRPPRRRRTGPNALEPLGIELRRERAGLDDVAEEHRDDLAGRGCGAAGSPLRYWSSSAEPAARRSRAAQRSAPGPARGSRVRRPAPGYARCPARRLARAGRPDMPQASACRPDRYSARISWPRSRSRSGWAPTSASSSPTQLGRTPTREVGLEAILDRKHAQLLEPRNLTLRERRVAEIRSAGPLQRPSASRSTAPPTPDRPPSAALPSPARRSNRPASICSPANCEAVAAALRHHGALRTHLRSRDTHVCSASMPDGGGRCPQSSSIKRSLKRPRPRAAATAQAPSAA